MYRTVADAALMADAGLARRIWPTRSQSNSIRTAASAA